MNLSLFSMIMALSSFSDVHAGDGYKEPDAARRAIIKMLEAMFKTELTWLKDNHERARQPDKVFETYCQKHFNVDGQVGVEWCDMIKSVGSDSSCAIRLLDTFDLVKKLLIERTGKTDKELATIKAKMQERAEGYKEFEELLIKAAADRSGTSSGQRAGALMSGILVILYSVN